MATVLGWLLVAGAIFLFASAFRRPDASASRERGIRRGPDRPKLFGALAGLAVGLLLAFWDTIALARIQAVDLSRHDSWRSNLVMGVDSPIRWEGSALVAEMEAGSGRYAAFPVDWEANRFEAEWDVTFTHLDRQNDPIMLRVDGSSRSHARSKLDYASVSVGLMDQNVSNIDDRDHVGGSAIEACFSDDIRLRASDANFVLRTAAHDESGKKEIEVDASGRNTFTRQEPIRIELGRKYHCRLTYVAPTKQADLIVTDGGGKEVVRRRLEDVKDFTNSVAWFGVSVRGYNRFDKKLDPKKGETGYSRPKAIVKIENISYQQP
jgi:hypothetical protein